MSRAEHFAPSPATAALPEDLGSAPGAERLTPLSLSEREARVLARVLEPNKYPLPGEDFTDVINEALAVVRRVMAALGAEQPPAAERTE